MKKQVIVWLFLLSPFLTHAQNIEGEINKDVWVPFTQAWETNNANLYNAVHTDDVWRINPGRLLIGAEYKSRNAERMQGQEQQRIIEFSFETRTSNGDQAYEVGYYRITDSADNEPKYYVGRFHVALIKKQGKWKIRQDWDTDSINGVKITPESLSKRTFIHFEK